MIGQYYSRIFNAFAVVFCNITAALVFSINIFQLNIQKCSLYFVQPAVKSLVFIYVFLFASVVAKCTNYFSQLIIVCGNRTGVAQGAKVFARVKAIAGGMAQRTASFAIPHRTNSLGIIFDNFELILICNDLKSRSPAYLSI